MTGLLPIRRKTQNRQSINMIIVCTLSISPKQCFFTNMLCKKQIVKQWQYLEMLSAKKKSNPSFAYLM